MMVWDANYTKYSLFLAVMISVLSVSPHAFSKSESSYPFVVSGVIKNSGNAQLINLFADYIAQKSGYPLHVVYANKYSELSRIMRDNPKAIGWTCGAPYVQDHLSNGQQLVVVPLYKQTPTYYSVILASSNRKEKSLADFRKAVFAYSDPRSNSGYLSPKYALFKQGIEMNKHFRLMINAGNHEGSINALINGLADVAAIDEYVWDAYIKDNPDARNKLKEIERMGPFPFTPIVAGNKVTKSSINKIALALQNMNKDQDGEDLLKKFYFDGFVIKNTTFYTPIQKMLEKVEIETSE